MPCSHPLCATGWSTCKTHSPPGPLPFSLLPSYPLTTIYPPSWPLISSIQLPASDRAAPYLSSEYTLLTVYTHAKHSQTCIISFHHTNLLLPSCLPLPPHPIFAFSPSVHQAPLILKPRSVTVPSAVQPVLTFLCPEQQWVVSFLNISSTCTGGYPLFTPCSCSNPILKTLMLTHTPFPPTGCQIHVRGREEMTAGVCVLQTNPFDIRETTEQKSNAVGILQHQNQQIYKSVLQGILDAEGSIINIYPMHRYANKSIKLDYYIQNYTNIFVHATNMLSNTKRIKHNHHRHFLFC